MGQNSLLIKGTWPHTWWLIPSFSRQPPLHSFTYLLACSLTHSFQLIHSLIRSVIHSLIQSLDHLLTHSLIHSLSFTHSFIQSLSHSVSEWVSECNVMWLYHIHSLIHSLDLTCSPLHSLTHVCNISIYNVSSCYFRVLHLKLNINPDNERPCQAMPVPIDWMNEEEGWLQWSVITQYR